MPKQSRNFNLKADPNQLKAIQFGDGPVLCNAGPGSGKTFVITHRILYLISSGRAAPEEILVITFTQAAARQMKNRYLQLSQESQTLVTFGTFHAFFYQIIRCYHKFQQIRIIPLELKKKIMKDVLCDLKMTAFDDAHTEELLSEIAHVKTFMAKPEEFHSSVINDREFMHVYFAYLHRLKQENLIDFEDMILKCLELVKANETVREMYRDRFRYILVDEFQDINPMQYEVLLQLFGNRSNIFAVGDDDQAIYGFRGSTPKMMFQFLDDYEQPAQILLSCNYRSREVIVREAAKVIQQNKERFNKEISTTRTEGVFQCLVFKERKEEIDWLLGKLREHRNNQELKDTAILFRTNAAAEVFCEFLSLHKIPYTRKEKPVCFYEHFIVKDVFAYLDFANGQTTRQNFYRMMNRPKRYIRRDYVRSEQIDWENLQKGEGCSHHVKKNLKVLAEDLAMLKELEPYAALVYLQKKMGYETFLVEEAFSQGKKYRIYEQIYEELKLRAKEFHSWKEFKAHVADYREKIAEDASENDNCLKIMSMHGAKGLEWNHVYLPMCNEGFIPHPRAHEIAETEEERRLFYVAMTRAKESLFLTCVDDKKRYHTSPFIEKLSKEVAYLSSSDSASFSINSSNS